MDFERDKKLINFYPNFSTIIIKHNSLVDIKYLIWSFYLYQRILTYCYQKMEIGHSYAIL